MIIKDMFSKPISRDIQGVIKVAQGGGRGTEEQSARQELEEYVVTREISRHFAEFFTNYKKGINGDTDKMGVWISGFFGSGKSHFLKMLAHLLEDKTVGGRHAIEYFEENGKITDAMVLANMKQCARISKRTDVILFNIDSKSDQNGKNNKDAIVNVFLKVFNEKMGFCGSIPHLAGLERNLSEKGNYEDFKNRYEIKYGKRWEDSRSNFDFIQDEIIDILVGMGEMSMEAARTWCGKSSGEFNISIEDFAKLVKNHIDKMGQDSHVVFLVDEVGQYIGDDSRLMLNLQTVTEDLGIICRGKAWVIVTSQQDIDSVSRNMRTTSMDFSKIQGRFNTRISLSSANVDEVIKKRILEKTPTAESTLTVLYEQNETAIKNLLLFGRESAEMKLYADAKSFVSVYPFVPYQFDLLAKVLTSIRTHGASGKHLSEGERSMLSLFKESAEAIKDREAGAIVPFNLFYDALHQFLDHSHKGVIERAYNNEKINPDKENQCFAVDLLKELFMVKYVKEIEANIENLTSLMVSSIHDDRISLKQNVERDLRILIGQKLVQKNGDVYTFLTDEEQDINSTIEKQNIETTEVVKAISDRIFDDIYQNSRFKYSKNGGRYTFGFDQLVDDRSRKPNQTFDIGVNVITPYHDVRDETALRLASEGNTLYLSLPDNPSFLYELTEALKIDKFLKTGLTGITSADDIRNKKGNERIQRMERSKTLLIGALENATIYVGGSRIDIATKGVEARVNVALEKLVDKVYNKISYIDAPKSENDIKDLIAGNNQTRLEVVDKVDNSLAVKEVSDHIGSVSRNHSKESLKGLTDRFRKAPYGFTEDDTRWIITGLFINGDVSLMLNGQTLNTDSMNNELFNYLTKKEYADKLLVEKKKRAGEGEKKAVRELLRTLFDLTPQKDDDDSLKSVFQKKAIDLDRDLMRYSQDKPRYPGKETIAVGKALMREVIQAQTQSEFYGIVSTKKDEFLRFIDDYEPLRQFHEGTQKKIFDEALEIDGIYRDSKVFINDPEIEEIHISIAAVL
ncbi:MAG: BREX system P-loop protein BrxC, partial [Candidatus Methanoplasma sp.]|nr:BREX system P-loop protein BrxC [Candidatus Methanoplasma sp.]